MIKSPFSMKHAAIISVALHLCIVGLAMLTLSSSRKPLINLDYTIAAELVSEKQLKPAKRQRKTSKKKAKQSTYSKAKPTKKQKKKDVVKIQKKKAVPAKIKPVKKKKVKIKKIKPKPQPKKQESKKPSFLKSVKNLEQKNAQLGTEERKSSWSEKLGSAIFTYQEMAALRAQIEQCWNIPVGAKNAENLVVEMRLTMNPDATVKTAMITDQSRMKSDPFFRTAGESAMRAIYNPLCAPLDLPLDKFEKWKDLTLIFNPRDILGF